MRRDYLMLGVGGLLLLSPIRVDAHSGGTGSNPATACAKVGTDGTLLIQSNGSIANSSSTASLTVDCPIISAGLGNPVSADTISYVDDSSSILTCAFASEAADSTAASGTTFFSVANDAATHTFNVSFTTTFAGGFSHLRCVIPPKDSQGNMSSVKGWLIDDDDFDEASQTGCGYSTQPASNCRLVESSGTVGITGDAAIFNQSEATAFLHVDCPVQGYCNEQAATSTSRTKMWYFDNSSHVISCTLASEDALGTAVHSLTLTSTGIHEAAYHSLDFSGANTVATFAGGYLHYRCNLPAWDVGENYLIGYAFSP